MDRGTAARSATTCSPLGILALCLCATGSAREFTLSSPDGRVEAVISSEPGSLGYRITHAGAGVIERSTLGISVDGKNLASGIAIAPPVKNSIEESYPWRGGKSRALNRCNGFEIPVMHQPSGTAWTLEVRVFDDGVAYRYRIPGTGQRRVDRETGRWQLPPRAQVWYQTNTANYEGEYTSGKPETIPVEKDQDGGRKPVFLGCPVTVELPGGKYILLTEASLHRYSGMSLRPTGTRTLEMVFEDDPGGFTVDGQIVSPWRVVIVTENLQDLVNSDIVPSLCDPPDPRLFPDGIDADWIRPGKALITWAVFGNDGARWERQKWFVDMCAALNCEYLLVDGGWRSERWGFRREGGDEWSRLQELCRYGSERNVGIFVWHAYPEGRNDGPGLTDRNARRAFLQRCKAAGVRGVKIDFFDSESKEIIDVYEDFLRLTAELRLMVSFHGANKPTGEARTWPHEITREGLREQEYLLWGSLPLEHYGALPFTRMVAGHGDFLPTYVREKYLKNTTAVFQLATAVVYLSPFICWPDHPEAYLESPFLPLIRTMPAIWDETRVLEGSAIGKFVALARRAGEDWYAALLNCEETERVYSLRLDFLGEGEYEGTLYRDSQTRARSIRLETGSQRRGATLSLQLPGGGGFVGCFRRPAEYTK